MKNYMDALKRRKDETGDSGFSLIELIVVVVILGVLAAIAVPVFLGLQGQAEQSAQDTAAANIASQVASNLAQDKDADDRVTLDLDGGTYTISPTTGALIDNFCVTVTGAADVDSKSGPGCTPTPAST
jgi:prepilin-type N-terminal cleavage/methylation domain-containing protein